MAVAISEKRLSLREFLELEERYPERRFKPAANGAVIEMSPSRSHGAIEGWIYRLLQNWLETEHMSDFISGTEITHDLGGWLCVPDVAVLPLEGEDYPREAPLLAVEIASKSNTRRELRAKAARYLERGTEMVWLVYPESRSLELCRAGEAMQTLAGGDVIEGGATLPGFRKGVSELFPPASQQ